MSVRTLFTIVAFLNAPYANSYQEQLQHARNGLKLEISQVSCLVKVFDTSMSKPVPFSYGNSVYHLDIAQQELDKKAKTPDISKFKGVIGKGLKEGKANTLALIMSHVTERRSCCSYRLKDKGYCRGRRESKLTNLPIDEDIFKKSCFKGAWLSPEIVCEDIVAPSNITSCAQELNRFTVKFHSWASSHIDHVNELATDLRNIKEQLISVMKERMLSLKSCNVRRKAGAGTR